jgi:cytochrome c553
MMRFRAAACLLLAGIILNPALAGAAASIAAGKEKSMQCAVCHGPNGVAVNPDAPNLAGEQPGYIERQLKAFRSGERKHEQMSIIASGLSDQDIGDLAAWFSAITITAQPPEVK